MSQEAFSPTNQLGSSPIAAAAAQTKHPVTQALVSMTQTFIDTIIVCTMTGLVLIVTDTWASGRNGADLTTFAFSTGFSGGAVVVAVSLALFAYSTILGWCYYGERSMEYLFGLKSI
ncbi:MAG: alanine:cation symporter family protein, partial [Geovibrio sp.]|nr:alanine:cation symporter family protein [Geovibrio sp.]